VNSVPPMWNRKQMVQANANRNNTAKIVLRIFIVFFLEMSTSHQS
jgi:hypothetical protein